MYRNYSTIPVSTLRALYLNEGKSVQEIASRFGCSANKINYLMKRNGIRKRTISDALYLKHNPHGDPFTFRNPVTASEHFLFGLGLGLYWGEGNKKNVYAIRLGNTDPRLILCFVRFLEHIYGVKKQKFRFGLQVFNDMDPEKAQKYWMKKLDVPRSSFGKLVVTPSRAPGTYRQKTKFGVLTVYVSNKKLRNLINAEIEKL